MIALKALEHEILVLRKRDDLRWSRITRSPGGKKGANRKRNATSWILVEDSLSSRRNSIHCPVEYKPIHKPSSKPASSQNEKSRPVTNSSHSTGEREPPSHCERKNHQPTVAGNQSPIMFLLSLNFAAPVDKGIKIIRERPWYKTVAPIQNPKSQKRFTKDWWSPPQDHITGELHHCQPEIRQKMRECSYAKEGFDSNELATVGSL